MTTQPNTEPLKVGEACREAFERDFHSCDLRRFPLEDHAFAGEYKEYGVQRMWIGYEAAWNRRTEPLEIGNTIDQSPAEVSSEGMVLVPDWHGYALLGTGRYILNASPPPMDPELGAEFCITLATEEDRAGNRQIGEIRDNTRTTPYQPEEIAIRIGFLTPQALDAMEAQLAILRKDHWPETVSQQSPARVEGELTDECFAEFLRHALKHAFNLGKTYQIQLDSSSLATGIERHATWAKLKQHTKDTIERALNQRLAVKEGEAVGDISKANWPFPYDKTFKAIGNAVHIEGGNLAISVMNFREAFGPLSTHPVSDDQQAKDAPAMVLFGYATGEHLDKLVPPGIGKTMTDVVALYAKADFTEFEAQQLDALSTTKQEG